MLVLFSMRGMGQEALQNLQALGDLRDQRRAQVASEDHTFKSGDFRLLATPSLGLDWNDNIRTSEFNPESDVIIRPALRLDASYPLTDVNLLTLNLGVGYDHYVDADDLSGWRVQSGSALSFDLFVRDFNINLHDRFSYSRDSSQEAAVANTADYGSFENTAGLSVAWALPKATLTLGYDHQNVISIESTFDSEDRATEIFSAQAAFVVHPELQAGVEGTASLTAYKQPTLNDNQAYTAGLFAAWKPGKAFRISPRGGFSLFQFENTSTSIRTEDLNSYYFDLSAVHDITAAFSYRLVLGHQIRLGVQSDVIEESYIRPSLTWRAFKRTALQFGLSYEHGDGGVGNQAGGLPETYDWVTATVGANWQVVEKVSLGVNYRLTLRMSDIAGREYNQNVIGLAVTYYPK